MEDQDSSSVIEDQESSSAIEDQEFDAASTSAIEFGSASAFGPVSASASVSEMETDPFG